MSESESKKKTKPDAPRKVAPGQGRRRMMYGTNVLIAVIAAIVVAALFNWLVDWQYRHTPPAVKDWVRYDLTATRRYTLAPQTQKLLGNLDQPRRIVTLFRVNTFQRQQVSDLTDEYARYSNQVAVEHVNPTRDVTGVDRLYRQVHQRYADPLGPEIKAIQRGLEVMKQAAGDLDTLSAALSKAAKTKGLADDARGKVNKVATVAGRESAQLITFHKQYTQAMDQSLPSYATIQSKVSNALITARGGLLDPGIGQFNQITRADSVPPAVAEALLKAVGSMTKLRNQVASAVNALQSAKPVRNYEEAAAVLGNNQAVAVMSPDAVRVIPIQRMYRKPNAKVEEQAGHTDQQFIGEEKLTGSLVSLGLKVPPMVVFVNSGGRQALGQRGTYSNVANQLRAADFKVTQWSPLPRSTRFGQQIPAQAPPKPAQGQQVVWVVPPVPPPNPQNPASLANKASTKVADLVKDRLSAGDAVLLMLNFDPAQQYGQADPMLTYLDTWGIVPRLDRLIVHERKAPDQPEAATSIQFRVNHWPDQLPVTQALASRRGVFTGASPIEIEKPGGQAKAKSADKGKAAGDGEQANPAKVYPLVRLAQRRMWTTADFSSFRQAIRAKYDPDTAAKTFTVGVAAQRNGRRLVVVADPAWASNYLTTFGKSPRGSGPGAANMPGGSLVYPANGELFVNSVYWLAGLDQLIAASARTQDIRRIASITDRQYNIAYLLVVAGVPVLVLACGVGVYLMRRRA